MIIKNLGFDPFFQQQIKQADNKVPGRVVLEHKHSYRVVTDQGEWLAAVSGHYAFHSFTRVDYPAVGDFVMVEQMPGEQRAIIHQLLVRKSKFSRKMAGTEIDEQIVAANVDFVFLVMSLNKDFNMRRLERYLVAAWDSGATPVIVLTKADLCENRTPYLEQLHAIAYGIDVVVVSAITGEGIEVIREMLIDGKTGALLGSSGAGKSTLVNSLLGVQQMEVSAIREDDAKGRHTTTHRELVVLPSGGCLIDTPGMRELQLWDQGEQLTSSFTDIDGLAATCRFRDCTHKKEPGCAVQRAVDVGELDEGRLASFFKLQRELAYMESKTSKALQLAEKRKSKQRSNHVKRMK